MDKKTLSDLDYYTVRDEISGFCVSEEGKYSFLKTEPYTDLQKIENAKQISKEWMALLSFTVTNPLSSWPEVFEILKILKIQGSSISVSQSYFLLLFIQEVQKISCTIKSASEKLNIKNLLALVENLPYLKNAEDEIKKIINDKGELKELPSLRAINSKIASLNSKIREIMRKFTSDVKYSKILESTVPVLSANRQVLAVKSSQRNVIPGIIHGLSNTGLTVFIEPDECVRCSNDLIEAEAELELEKKKILLSLTDFLRGFKTEFFTALEIMKKFDSAQAVSLWALKNHCTFAQTVSLENDSLTLLNARHPLLKEKAVPIDVQFLPGKKVLILTGPNTGGKTVTLKTIALFALLNQSGFPILACEGSKLPVFTKIFADIGDEQSLEQSLSTFSGHMKNISKAVKYADSSSLVLLDELGSGTDPQEGSAISMAILDSLIKKDSFVFITTHQGLIKNYGYTHEKCINASVDFNSDTLSPTYKILMGIPGESHALSIAEKNGIPKEIVKNAREYISTKKADVSSLIKGLSQKHKEVLELKEQIEKEKLELDQKLLKTEQKALLLKEKEFELKQKSQDEADDFLSETRKNLENLVRVLKEGEITREKTLSVKKFIRDFEQKTKENALYLEQEKKELESDFIRISKLSEKIPVSHKKTKRRIKNSQALKDAEPLYFPSQKTTPHLYFKIGAEVQVKTSNQRGTIISFVKEGIWQVQFQSLKMNLSENELILLPPENVEKSASYSVEYSSDSSFMDEKPCFELRLLGLRENEALKSLEKQLDLCAIHNLKNFSVIHGKGNGILQAAVQHYLSLSPLVKEFSFAPPEDGGSGKTYVSLK